MSETYIPLSQINTYVFCPRRFYYESVEGHQVVNAHVEEGKIKHEHVHTAVTDRRKGDKTISRRQYLASDALGVSGYTDLVEEKDGIPYPVEFKKECSTEFRLLLADRRSHVSDSDSRVRSLCRFLSPVKVW